MPRTTIPRTRQIETTLLDLVNAVGATTDDEQEMVATVARLLKTRRARLMGTFRGAPLEVVLPPEMQRTAV